LRTKKGTFLTVSSASFDHCMTVLIRNLDQEKDNIKFAERYWELRPWSDEVLEYWSVEKTHQSSIH
jgi:hypothetical protein